MECLLPIGTYVEWGNRNPYQRGTIVDYDLRIGYPPLIVRYGAGGTISLFPPQIVFHELPGAWRDLCGMV